MSDKLAAGGRYNRISPSSGRGSIIAYSPLPKSEQDCLQAPGNNCLAIPLSAIQTENNQNHQKAMPPMMPPLAVVGGAGGKGTFIGNGANNHGHHDGTTAAGHKHAGQSHNNPNNNGNVELVVENLALNVVLLYNRLYPR